MSASAQAIGAIIIAFLLGIGFAGLIVLVGHQSEERHR